MDTSSSRSFISYDYAKKYNLKINPASGTVSMVSSLLNALLKGQCSSNINLLGEFYSNIQLSVFPGFCEDITLGQDFMNHHSSVSFTFGGPRKSLIISNPAVCSVPSTSVDSLSLFWKLIPNCKPIVTKYWRFGNEDKQRCFRKWWLKRAHLTGEPKFLLSLMNVKEKDVWLIMVKPSID